MRWYAVFDLTNRFCQLSRQHTGRQQSSDPAKLETIMELRRCRLLRPKIAWLTAFGARADKTISHEKFAVGSVTHRARTPETKGNVLATEQ